MTSADANQLHRKFITAAEAEEVLRELDRLDDLAEPDALPAPMLLNLRHLGLRALHRILGGDAMAAQQIILERLLPICLQDAESEALEQNIALIDCRELAGEWLNALSGGGAAITMQKAIDFLIAQLETPTWLPACWTISEIGYRDLRLTESLWTLAEFRDRAKSDTALATLAALGLSGDERERCLAAALAAGITRLPYTIVGTLAALPDSATIPALEEAWLARPDSELEMVVEQLFSLFAHIGARLEDPDAVDRASIAIANLVARAPAALGRRVRLAGNALPGLDSPIAAETLIRLLPQETDNVTYDRWLVMLRLEACCRPRQLPGLQGDATRNPAVFAALSEAVLAAGEHPGRESTLEGQEKISAVKTALLLGLPRAVEWLGPSLANEANPYLQQEIMEAYAALRVSPLPEPIPRWIVEEKRLGHEAADNVELLRRLAASRVARSAGTSEAFGLLLRPGLIREDSVMMETVEGLIAATLCLGADPAQRPRVLEQLFTAIEKPATLPQLSSACHALAAAARREWLAQDAWPERLLNALISEPTIPLRSHDRAQLVGAVEALPPAARPSWLRDRLAAWADTADAVGERSALALIEMGYFSQLRELLAPKLGLTPLDENRWHWNAGTTNQLEWAPLGVVLLYAQAPESFCPAVCAVFDDERWFVRHDAAGLLQSLVLRDRATLLEPVRDALMRRMQRRQSSRSADPPLIRQVALLMPERFARERWSNLYGDWMDDARIALADALGSLPQEMFFGSPELHQSVATQLVELARDGLFSVRRSAQRSLGNVHPRTLAMFCETLGAGTEVEERILAAEASAWLPSIAVSPPHETPRQDQSDWFWKPHDYPLLRRFEADCSKRVRNQARDAAASRRRREWAKTYYVQLAMLAEPSDSDLLESWKIGNALARTGDDETLRCLHAHLDLATLAPSLRFRLSCVAKDMEKNWEEVTKKWPQPSISLPGGLATFEARLRSQDKEWMVRCTLWHIAGVTANAERRWGGIAVTRAMDVVAAFADTEALLVIGNSETRVFVNKIANEGLITFRGLGVYPQVLG